MDARIVKRLQEKYIGYQTPKVTIVDVVLHREYDRVVMVFILEYSVYQFWDDITPIFKKVKNYYGIRPYYIEKWHSRTLNIINTP